MAARKWRLLSVGILVGCGATAIVAKRQRGISRGNDRDGQDERRGDVRYLGTAHAIFRGTRQRATRRTSCPHQRRSQAHQLVGGFVRWWYLAALLIAALPLDWLDDIGGFFAGIGSGIINAIKGILRAALSVITSWIHDAVTLLGSLVSDLTTFVDNAWSDFQAYIGQVAQRFVQAYDDLEHFAVSAAQSILNTFAGWATAAIGWATDAIHVLDSWARSAVSFIENNLIAPLVSWIDQAAGFVGNILSSWWNDIYANVIGPAFGTFSWTFHALSSVWDWLTHDAMAAVLLVERASGWLVWLADHALGDIESLLSSGPHVGPRLAQFIDTAHGGAAIDSLGDYIEKVFG